MDMDVTASSDKLVFSKRTDATKIRLLAGITGLLVLAVIGLVVALVVVSNNNNNNNNNSSDKIVSDGQTGVKDPDCPLNPGSDTPNLDKANCILDSYPLVDG